MSDLSIGIEKPNTTTKVEKAPDNLYTITTSTTQIFTRTQNQDKVLCCSNIGETRCETKNINVLCKYHLWSDFLLSFGIDLMMDWLIDF
jgi:hypothetical protein